MKMYVNDLFLMSALIAEFGLMSFDRLTAGTFTTLYSFTATSPDTWTNSDGADPESGLILWGNTLYGTTRLGGSSGQGTVFKINTDGTGFTVLYNFPDPSDGDHPYAGLVLSSNILYGAAQVGGSSSNGTVFALNTDGTGFTNLYNFTATSSSTPTNSDGAYPLGGLILSGSTLYGTANWGGSSGNGTVFAVNIDGTGFTTLHSFTALNLLTNSDGAGPNAGLTLSGNILYGTTTEGGSSGNGTVFALNTDGTRFTNLYNFTAASGPYPATNSDGAGPNGGLILSGSTLYGTANWGGSSGSGTVFALNTDGTRFTNLYNFTATSGRYPATNSDGALPKGGLILSGNILYGTTTWGGSSGNGTLFSISLGTVGTPPLTLISSGVSVIVTWPTNAAGFALQSTTNLISPAVWTAVFPRPVVINGQNVVTNPVSGIQRFYRLAQ